MMAERIAIMGGEQYAEWIKRDEWCAQSRHACRPGRGRRQLVGWRAPESVQERRPVEIVGFIHSHWQQLRDAPCLIHFRLATHGAVEPRNCHPFHTGGISRIMASHTRLAARVRLPQHG